MTGTNLGIGERLRYVEFLQKICYKGLCKPRNGDKLKICVQLALDIDNSVTFVRQRNTPAQ